MMHVPTASEQNKRPDLKDFEDRTIDLLQTSGRYRPFRWVLLV